MTVTYDWATDSTEIVANMETNLLYPVTTSFVVITTLALTPDTGSVGIKVSAGLNEVYYSVGPLAGPNVITPEASTFLGLEWSDTDSVCVPFCSSDGETWVKCEMPLDEMGVPMPYPVLEDIAQAGLFFLPSDVTEQRMVFGSPRVLPGSIFVETAVPGIYEVLSEEQTLEPIGAVPPTQPDPITPSQEAVVHALVGAPFGDLEFDVGKSVGWLQRFVDDIFVSDVNYGDQRYWVVNWSKTFYDTYYRFSRINYFQNPAAFRQGQVDDALKYAANYPNDLTYDDNDWVIFLDAHEGLSVDNRSYPDDFLISPFQSYIFREIARANAASRDRVVIPFFVHLRHDHIQNVSQSYEFEGQKFTATQSAGVPYYLPYQGLTRMFKMSALRSPTFNWAILDTPVAVVDPTVKIQIVTYAYAHWNLQDVPPGETSVPPLDANNDLGWQQRCMISQVLPITGLPVGSATNPVGTWVNPSADPVGKRGPWAFERYVWHVTDPVFTPPPPIDPEVQMVLTPMYDLVFRLNVRDGVWYDTDGLGNTEVVWDPDTEEFVPYVPPPVVPTSNLDVSPSIHLVNSGSVTVTPV